jgi:hypothetical protein
VARWGLVYGISFFTRVSNHGIGTDDINENTAPLTPYARILDAIKPDDEGIPIIASGGVTTSLILPGSSNIMGGRQPDCLFVDSSL